MLVTVTRVAAPLLPMLAEEIHTALTGERSVHLVDWPEAGSLPADPELVRAMDEVRAVCSTALGLREDNKLRNRLPLTDLAVAGGRAEALASFTGLISDELNVKSVTISSDRTAYGTEVVRPDPRVLGPRLGREVQAVLKAARDGDWQRDASGGIVVGGHALQPGEYELALQTDDSNAASGRAAEAVRYVDPEGRMIDTGLVVALDLTVTPELHAEGVTRDLVRLVQQARRDADLDVTDRIVLTLSLPETQRAMVEAHQDHLAASVLATTVAYTETPGETSAPLDGATASWTITRS